MTAQEYQTLLEAIRSLHEATELGFSRHERRFEKLEGEMNHRFLQLDRQFGKVLTRLDGIDVWLGRIDDRLGRVERLV